MYNEYFYIILRIKKGEQQRKIMWMKESWQRY